MEIDRQHNIGSVSLATEKTKFDDWLKEKLWRDLIFRTLIWASVALLALYFAISIDAETANAYFIRQTKMVFRLSNVFGTLAIFLGIVAMMFKDLEALTPERWGQDTFLGFVGGIIRRLAGDLTLWTLGAILTVLLTITVFGFKTSGSWRDLAIYSYIYLIIVAMCFFDALLNVAIRRTAPFVANYYKNSLIVGLAYFIVIVTCLTILCRMP